MKDHLPSKKLTARKKGQKVFISAGAGGVGSIALQIAKNIIGAEVYTTASEKKLDLCKQLGADTVINYKTQKFDEILKDMDVCFDVVGEAARCLNIVKKNGVC